jgi:hypothetical protein
MDGILDANNDMFADLPRSLRSRFAWIKTTISSFRVHEQVDYLQDAGWTVRPLLICRDVREAYASLRTKRYGRNGITAEDPPLRLRLRRFREDWERFCANDWPILRYEQFLVDPEEVLAAVCARLGLPWDDAMLTWPKPKADIFDGRHGNETFRLNRGTSLFDSLKASARPAHPLVIPASEHVWLENEFAHFNQVNGYPAHLPASADADDLPADMPSFNVTRRAQWRPRKLPLRSLLHQVAQWFASEAVPEERRELQTAVRNRNQAAG